MMSGQVESTAGDTPNDDLLEVQWGLKDIEALAGWHMANLSAKFYKPKVVVIDSGIDYRHEDIAMNAFINYEELYGDDSVDDDGNGFVDDILGVDVISSTGYPLDKDGTGTHAAGIIGAMTNNALGIAGVHYGNPTLVPCKFLDSGFGFTSDAIKCIDYAMAVKADVISNFFGSYYHSAAFLQSLNMASQSGMTIVAAAGDTGEAMDVHPYYPCAYPVDGLLCVAATSESNELATWSSYGTSDVALAAPGVEIVSTSLDQSYLLSSSTSMAGAFVAGSAAFLKSANKDLSNFDIVDILKSTAKPFSDWKLRVGFGKINLAAAVTLAVSPMYLNSIASTTTGTPPTTGTSTTTVTPASPYTGTGTPPTTRTSTTTVTPASPYTGTGTPPTTRTSTTTVTPALPYTGTGTPPTTGTSTTTVTPASPYTGTG
eukprot:Lankesteria_metandrocarpae@DN5256_c1_g1_i10.p1